MNTQYNDPKGAAGALKTPLGLIPPFAMAQTALAHKYGAEKYGPFNWRDTGVCASTYVNAIMRHLNAWRDGEDLDPESGISHLAHVACSCNILLDAGYCRTLQDDRNITPNNELTKITVDLIKKWDKEKSAKEPEPEPEPKPVYRMLEVGELLREDDEVYFKPEGWQPYGGADCKVNPSGINPVGYYRRKIEPEPEPEYYYLGHEDVIEKGDEFYDSFEDVWVKSSYIGRPAGKLITSVPYRRPIKQDNVAEESSDRNQCECGRFLISNFLMGAICEDCDLQWQDPY